MKKFIIFFILFFTTKAHAFSIKHDFTVLIGVFNASKTSFEYELTPRSYAITSNVKTAGIFNTLYPFKAEYSTTGKIKNKEFETTSYKYSSQSRFTKRSKELIYDNKGNPVYAISSKNDKEKKKEIKQEANNKDTTDLQTVFAELAAQYNRVKFCDSRMEVFDGKRRFDVIFKDEGQEEIKANEFSAFSGLATKCSMFIDKLDEKDDDLLWEATAQRPIYFWILEEETSQHPFIARIEVKDTPLGQMRVYTNKITVKE